MRAKVIRSYETFTRLYHEHKDQSASTLSEGIYGGFMLQNQSFLRTIDPLENESLYDAIAEFLNEYNRDVLRYIRIKDHDDAHRRVCEAIENVLSIYKDIIDDDMCTLAQDLFRECAQDIISYEKFLKEKLAGGPLSIVNDAEVTIPAVYTKLLDGNDVLLSTYPKDCKTYTWIESFNSKYRQISLCDMNLERSKRLVKDALKVYKTIIDA